MNIEETITELERRCPGCSFKVDTESMRIHIIEYGRRFVVSLERCCMSAEEWFERELEKHPADEAPVLEPDEKYRVICPRCGIVVIGYGNYFDQLNRPDHLWYCPQCKGRATFDDEQYENYPDTPEIETEGIEK